MNGRPRGFAAAQADLARWFEHAKAEGRRTLDMWHGQGAQGIAAIVVLASDVGHVSYFLLTEAEDKEHLNVDEYREEAAELLTAALQAVMFQESFDRNERAIDEEP